MQTQTSKSLSKTRYALAGFTVFIIGFLITLGTRLFIALYLPDQIQSLGIAEALIEIALKLSLAVISILFILFVHRESLGKFGISWGRTPVRHLTLGGLTALLWLLLDYSVLVLIFGSSVITFINLANVQWAVWLFWFLHLLTLNSVGEEIESRAYLQTVFSRATGIRGGIIISAVLFGIGHIPINIYFYGSSPLTTLVNVAGAALFGLIAGYLCAVTGNILASISLHSVLNVMQASVPWQINIPTDASFTLYAIYGLAIAIISFIILALLILLHKHKPNWLRTSEAK